MSAGHAWPIPAGLLRLLASLALLAAFGSTMSAGAQTSSETLIRAEDLGLAELVITAGEDGWDAPDTVQAGRYLLTVTYDGQREFATTAFAKLPEDWTIDDFNQRLSETDAQFGSSTAPDLTWLYDLTLAGGVSPTPGTTEQAIIDLLPGDWAIWADDFTPPARALTVTGDLPTVRPIPERSATISGVNSEGQYQFVIDGEMLAGQQIIEIVNQTSLPMYIEFMRLSHPVSDEQLRAFLITPAGLAPDPALAVPADFSATVSPFYSALQSPGVTQWMVSDLAPGSWGIVCWLPDPQQDGASLASLGMIATFDVREPN